MAITKASASCFIVAFCFPLLHAAEPASLIRASIDYRQFESVTFEKKDQLRYEERRVFIRNDASGLQERAVQNVSELKTYLTLKSGRWIILDKERVALRMSYADPFDHQFQDSLKLLDFAGLTFNSDSECGEYEGADVHITMFLSPALVEKLKMAKTPVLTAAGISAKEARSWLENQIATERHFFIDSRSRTLIGYKSFNSRRQILVSNNYAGYMHNSKLPIDIFKVPPGYKQVALTSPEEYRRWTQKKFISQKETFFKNFERVMTNKPAQTEAKQKPKAQ